MPAITTHNYYNLSGVASAPGTGDIRRVLYQTTLGELDLQYGGNFSIAAQVIQVTSPRAIDGGIKSYLEFWYQIVDVTHGDFLRPNQYSPLAIAIAWAAASPSVKISFADCLSTGPGLIVPNTFQTTNYQNFAFSFNLGIPTGCNSRQFFVVTNATRWSMNSSYSPTLLDPTAGPGNRNLLSLPGPTS
jgi:hypothetical protein